jgi:hypothetical protein
VDDLTDKIISSNAEQAAASLARDALENLQMKLDSQIAKTREERIHRQDCQARMADDLNVLQIKFDKQTVKASEEKIQHQDFQTCMTDDLNKLQIKFDSQTVKASEDKILNKDCQTRMALVKAANDALHSKIAKLEKTFLKKDGIIARLGKWKMESIQAKPSLSFAPALSFGSETPVS